MRDGVVFDGHLRDGEVGQVGVPVDCVKRTTMICPAEGVVNVYVLFVAPLLWVKQLLVVQSIDAAEMAVQGTLVRIGAKGDGR